MTPRPVTVPGPRRSAAISGALALATTLVAAAPALAAGGDPPSAGGAAIREIAIASSAAMALTAVLFWFGWAHRKGRTDVLRRMANFWADETGLPPWAGLPVVLAAASLITAAFGMMWDISLHIDNGRDPGPLANPAHYFILFGLYGIFAAGFLACVLPEGKPSAASVKLGPDWWAPIGGITFLACSSFALAGFPLDDFWHRIFGQDVTLWGPTHLMLIGGAGTSLLGIAMLLIEGKVRVPIETSRVARNPIGAFMLRHRPVLICGAFLIGLSVYQGEYDFGVQQFRLVFHPILIAFAAGVALTTARIYAGKGAAIGAALMFIVVRGGIALVVGPVLGETTPLMPLYLAEAVLVEAAALAISPSRTYQFGTLSGLLIGTLGFAAECAYSQIGFRVHWPALLLGEGALLVPLVGIGSGLVGAFIGASLANTGEAGVRPAPRLAPAVVGFLAIIAVTVYGLDTKPAEGVRGSVTLADVTPAPNRTVQASVRITPASATKDADWVEALSWQGEGFIVNKLKKTGPDTWSTTRAMPVHGDWKTLIRVHKGRSLVGIPVYLPEDKAIPVAGVPASRTFDRPFVKEKLILQREQKKGISSSLTTAAYTVVGLIGLSLILTVAWALVRVAGGGSTGGAGRRRRDAASTHTPATHGGAA